MYHEQEIERLRTDAQLAGNDPRNVKQIFDDLTLCGGVALNHFDGVRRAVSIELSGTKQFGPSHYRVQRRSQLVRNSCEKLLLQPARLFRLLARLTLAL